MNVKPNSIIHLEPGDTLPGHKNVRPVPDKFINELHALIDKLNKQPGTIFFKLKQLYAFLTRFNRDFVSTFTSCQKGCSSCCKMDVQITPFEAEFIRMATTIPARSSSLTTGHYSSCPFLSEKGMCSIYNYRPLICRTYHVLSDPALCADSKAQVLQYGSYSSNMGNYIYLTIARWIHFQTQHATGSLELLDIRDYFPYSRENIQDFIQYNPPKPFC